jgi:hypothetical protein
MNAFFSGVLGGETALCFMHADAGSAQCFEALYFS